jgi:hypothetical protein
MEQFRQHVEPHIDHYKRIAEYKRARGLHAMMKKAPTSFLDNMYYLVKNINRGNLKITDSAKQKLYRHRKMITKAASNKRACRKVIKNSRVGATLSRAVANIVNDAVKCPTFNHQAQEAQQQQQQATKEQEETGSMSPKAQ